MSIKENRRSVGALFLALVFFAGMVLSLAAPLQVQAAAQPSAKITLTAQGRSKTSVTLKWTTQYPYSRYRIYRAKGSGSFKKISEVTKKNYTDKKLTTGKVYKYKVVGVKGSVRTETATKKVTPMQTAKARVSQGDGNHTVISWDYKRSNLSAVDGFLVYRKSSGGKYKKLGKLSKNAYWYSENKTNTYAYYDTASKGALKTYTYKVVPYKGKLRGSAVSCDFQLRQFLNLTTNTDSIYAKWGKLSSAAGYEVWADIYKITSDGGYEYVSTKMLKRLSGADKLTYTLKNVNTKKYAYGMYISSYKMVGGTRTEICQSRYTFSDSGASLMRSKAAGKAITPIKVINTRGKKAKTAWKEGLSKEEKKIFSDFSKLHFQSGMNKVEKAEYVLVWINRNVAYDYDYKTSSKYGYVKSIFKYKKGQCLQYNGAYIKYLAYLGYETRIIQGYRVNKNPHFWGEIKINGRWFCMEAGNYGKDGYWRHFCARYGDSGASNYTKLGKKL